MKIILIAFERSKSKIHYLTFKFIRLLREEKTDTKIEMKEK